MNIIEIQILSDNIIETEKFYNNVLEFKTIYKDHTTVSFSAGLSILTFIQTNNRKPFYHFAFNIPTNKLDEAFQWIEARTEILQVDPGNKIADFQNWNAKSFYFFDNNRNILEFIIRKDLDNINDNAFNSSSIISISEIGLVTDSARQLCEKLISEYSLSIYSKSARLINSLSMGDDNELLIIVDAGRVWYPANKPAEKYWTKIILQEDGKTIEIKFNE